MVLFKSILVFIILGSTNIGSSLKGNMFKTYFISSITFTEYTIILLAID